MTRDVVIAGGGPVGLMLACELALAGVSTVVVEREPAPVEQLKAGAVTRRTVQTLASRGLTERLDGVMPLPDELTGHVAGIMKLAAPAVVDSEPAVILVMQVQVERMLQARALELGVDLRRGQQVTGFTQDTDALRVRTDGDVLHCRYLVGCDGGRSTVRKVAGFPFPGTDPTVTCRQGIVTMEGSEDLPTGWNHTPTGLFVHGPGPRLMVVEFDGPPADRDEPVTHEDMQDSLFRVSGVQVRITRSKWLSRFTDNTRLATTYRDGRVLLAGDAAHVHAPWGGQGLNLGIQDAVNLGWKLAATVNGWAPEDLLDTYTAERRPVAARVLDNTRAQQALMRPGPHATAVRELFSDLMDYEPVRRHLGELIGFTDVRYDPRIPDADDLVGRYTPDRVDLSRGRAVLVGPAELDRLAAGWADRVERRSDAGSGRGLLIRPDGYVAWAGDAAGKGLDDALVTWFGRPDQ